MKRKILICGLPGSGKTTLTGRHDDMPVKPFYQEDDNGR